MKNILVPIDYSDATHPVIDFVRDLATALKAEIHLVHVKEIATPAAAGAMGYGVFGVPDVITMSSGPVTGVETMPRDAMTAATQQRRRRDRASGLAEAGLTA